jgi:hypothetical protein
MQAGGLGGGAAGAKKTVLSDRFLIGEELGRGAYGQVFKGMDAHTGDVVAIKQISLSGVSQENLVSVMGEIDLLKTLNHKNIVKYIGSFKTRTHLYIILEFMENGSLSSVIKPNRFGVFPESLVAIYITQVGAAHAGGGCTARADAAAAVAAFPLSAPTSLISIRRLIPSPPHASRRQSSRRCCRAWCTSTTRGWCTGTSRGPTSSRPRRRVAVGSG